MRPEDLLTDEFLKQFKSRETLNDFLVQLQKRGIEKMLEGELDVHLGYDKHEQSSNNNSRNGYGKKRVRTSYGESEIRMPRDRDASFNPMIVPKRESMVDGIEEVIVSLYAKGMSVADIEDQIRDVYNFEVSTSTISRITSRIAEDIVSWQNRPLEPVYLIVWMDGIVFKVRENSKVVNKTVYIAVGLKRDGYKEILGMWLGKNESAAYWMSVLTDMKARGLQDILITATDNLNGFTQTIRSVFPESATQICVVHQIRAAEIATVGDGHAQIGDHASERINDRTIGSGSMRKGPGPGGQAVQWMHLLSLILVRHGVIVKVRRLAETVAAA